MFVCSLLLLILFFNYYFKESPCRVTNVCVSFPSTHKNDRYEFLQTSLKHRAQKKLVRMVTGIGLERTDVKFSSEWLSQLVADLIFVPLKHGFSLFPSQQFRRFSEFLVTYLQQVRSIQTAIISCAKLNCLVIHHFPMNLLYVHTIIPTLHQ